MTVDIQFHSAVTAGVTQNKMFASAPASISGQVAAAPGEPRPGCKGCERGSGIELGREHQSPSPSHGFDP